MKLSIMFTFLYFTAVAQQKAKSYPLPPVMNYYLTDNDAQRHVVFKYNTQRDSYIFSGKVKAASLSVSEMASIEQLITKRVDKHNKRATGEGDKIKNPEKYYKQFIAITNSKGEKIVWVKCSCLVTQGVWKTRLESVSDGGKCYFIIKINLTMGTVVEFSVNGLA